MVCRFNTWHDRGFLFYTVTIYAFVILSDYQKYTVVIFRHLNVINCIIYTIVRKLIGCQTVLSQEPKLTDGSTMKLFFI